MCCVFLLGCIRITVFTINNIFDMILVTNIYSKYHYYNFLSRPHRPHYPLCPRFRLPRTLLVSRKRGHWGQIGDGRDKYCFYKLTLFLN